MTTPDEEMTSPFVLPPVATNPFPLDPTKKYEVKVWYDGRLLERYERAGNSASAYAAGLFKLRNSGRRDTAVWLRLGDELKVAFARPWAEGDYVVYLVPLSD